MHVLNDIVLNQVRIPVSNWSTAEGDIDRFADVGLPNIEDAAARIARLGGESHRGLSRCLRERRQRWRRTEC